jgi:flagellar basal body rod protein FlgG
MNYGLYLSASGAMTNMYRQDVFANNLSNVETAGFKPDVPSLKHRKPEALEDGVERAASDRMLEQLGGGVLAGPQRISFGPAELERTGNPLDAALPEKNTFFAVERMTGEGEAEVALTRNGQFSRNGAGELVNQSGRRVLNENDEPIMVGEGGSVNIDQQGRILQDGEVVDRLQVARVEATQELEKAAGNLFTMPEADLRQPVEQPAVKSGFIETSGVEAIDTLMKLISSTKSVQGNANMIKYHDRVMEQAVTRLGRVG